MAAPGFERPDYYQILQIDPSADLEVIRSAYRTLLRVLGKHPDLGGRESEARNIIEAYSILSDPERRRVYDQWLQAHSSAKVVAAPGPAPIVGWIRSVLPEYVMAPKAPFARSFDLVLEGPGRTAPRFYVKLFSLITRANWPTIFVLCRAVGVARQGMMPSTDVVLVTAREIDEIEPFLRETARHSVRWAWNRCQIAALTLSPLELHTKGILVLPDALKRLRSDLQDAPAARPALRRKA